MEIYTIQRPSLLPVFCAPSSASVRAQLPQVHQAPTQSELVRDLVPAVGGSNGTTVFRGNEGVKAAKPAAIWMTDARGVPPRGRPV